MKKTNLPAKKKIKGFVCTILMNLTRTKFKHNVKNLPVINIIKTERN